MTNFEKRQLKGLVLAGKNFKEIKSIVSCSDATIKLYIKALRKTPNSPEGGEK